MPVYSQSIWIAAAPHVVDHCITDPKLMHQWLNPLLKCESVGSWSLTVGSRFRFLLQIPLLQPALECVVSERREGLVEWSFQGFFRGRDRWECQVEANGTLLNNCFDFEIPNPWIAWGYRLVAEQLTQRDMQDQLQRLKWVAESQSGL